VSPLVLPVLRGVEGLVLLVLYVLLVLPDLPVRRSFSEDGSEAEASCADNGLILPQSGYISARFNIHLLASKQFNQYWR